MKIDVFVVEKLFLRAEWFVRDAKMQRYVSGGNVMWYVLTFIVGSWVGFGIAALMAAAKDHKQ